MPAQQRLCEQFFFKFHFSKVVTMKREAAEEAKNRKRVKHGDKREEITTDAAQMATGRGD